jgi:hypothetical protein
MMNIGLPSEARYQGITVIHSGQSTSTKVPLRPSVDRRSTNATSKIGP